MSATIEDRRLVALLRSDIGEVASACAQVRELLKKNHLPIFTDVELEYAIPKDSDAVKEVAKCVQFCKSALA